MTVHPTRRTVLRVASTLLVAGPLAACVGTAYVPLQPRSYDVAADVLFAFGSATLRPEASVALNDILVSIRQTFPYPLIRVEGNTDSIGSDAANDALSLRRAEAVQAWLVANGIPRAAITTVGLGKRNPIAPNTLPNGADNPDGRARNRRVVLIASPA